MKLYSITLLITFAALMLAVCILPASATTFTVAGSGGADYMTIQEAANVANHGDIIYVYNGTYSENVNVYTRVTLQGEGANVVNVIANLTSTPVFYVMCDYVNISGFNVTGATTSSGFFISSRQHCNISDNNASGNSHGIYLYDSNNNTLTSNTLNSNNLSGICLASSSNNTVTSNTLNSNNHSGIQLYTSSNNMLTNNNISNNTIYGIYLTSSSSNNTLTSNTVSNNKNSGIFLQYSSNNTLKSNNAYSNINGIFLESSSNNKFTSNNAYLNTNGIYLYNSSNNMLTNNTADNNTGSGIILELSSNNALTNNTADNNTVNGIYLYNSSNNNTFTNNTADNNTGDGIYLISSSNNTLVSNNVSNNNNSGITLSLSNNNTLTSNTADNNTGNGIILFSLSNSTLTSNIAYSNTYHGIYQHSSSNNTLMSNNAYSNNYSGIILELSSNNTLTNNNADNNTENGIYLYTSSNNNTLTSNIVNSNKNSGIFLDLSSNNNTLMGNTADNNAVNGIILFILCNNNTLMGNTADNNAVNGIYLYNSSNNTIYNNYFSNTYNAWDNGNNTWNTTIREETNIMGGPWLGGNYWSDYTGNDTDSDGLGDTLTYNSRITYGGDYHPLVQYTTPPAPASLTNNIGYYWVNYTWTAGSGIVTDGYNVTMNGMWANTTNTYLNSSVGAGNWSDITVWAWNATGDGNRSDDSKSYQVQAPAAVTAILQRINITETSQTLNISEFMTFNATGYDHTNAIYPSNITFTWYTTPSGIGTLNATTGSVVNFTALHAGRTEIYAVNGSISSKATDSVWITVNAPTEIEDVTNGTGNATSGNSTAIVNLNNKSVNGTITIEELGDPLNETEDIGNRTGLGTDSEPIKGVNVTVNESIEAALNDTGGYVHIRIDYNQSQIDGLGIDEDTLYIYKFVNGTGWVELVQGNPTYCIANGRNTTADYIWVNVTNCSTFLLAGTPTAEPTPTPTRSSSGGSGGGGGGGTSGELYENIAYSETDRQHVYIDSDISYSFELEYNIVQFVKFTSLKSAGEVATKIEMLKDTSALVDNPPSDIVYKNLNIWVGNAGWATEKNIADATVVFTVDKSWITGNNIDESSIALYRYSNNNWNKLVTRKIAEDANSLQFEAETPGFSPFVVTGKETMGKTGAKDIAHAVTAEKTPASTPTEEKGTPGFGIFVGLSVLLTAVGLLHKKK